jgi:hypothetical protein
MRTQFDYLVTFAAAILMLGYILDNFDIIVEKYKPVVKRILKKWRKK